MSRRQPEVFHIPGFVVKSHEPCPDCSLEDRVAIDGRPRFNKDLGFPESLGCETCQGKGEIPLSGSEQVDPYARRR